MRPIPGLDAELIRIQRSLVFRTNDGNARQLAADGQTFVASVCVVTAAHQEKKNAP